MILTQHNQQSEQDIGTGISASVLLKNPKVKAYIEKINQKTTIKISFASVLIFTYICLQIKIIMADKSNKKDYSITFRMKESEAMWLERAAQSEIMSVSSFLRRAVVKHLMEKYPKLEKK